MNFFKEFKNYLKADNDIIKDRISHCRECEFLTRKCGCFMKIKTLLAHSKCPIGKW